jgi:hypothetical protein
MWYVLRYTARSHEFGVSLACLLKDLPRQKRLKIQPKRLVVASPIPLDGVELVSIVVDIEGMGDVDIEVPSPIRSSQI